MKKMLSLIIIGLLGLSMFLMFLSWTAEAQEIVWNTNPTPLPNSSSFHMSIVHNGRIYVISGYIDEGVLVPDVYFADINSDGTVGSWVPTTPLPEWRSEGTAVSWNNFVYVIAGRGPPWGGRSEQNTVFSAYIRSDGQIEKWNNEPNLPERLLNHAAVVWNGRIYVLGGWNGYSSQDKTYYAEINSVDGSLGNWNENPIDLPFPWESTCASVHDGRIYMFGGWHGPNGPPHDKVYSASIETDGTVGIWDENPSLPEERAWTRCALINDDIYVVGGSSGPSIAEKTVYKAKLGGDWTEVQSIPEARIGHSVVTFQGRIYVTGGHDSEWRCYDTIYYSSPPTVSATIDIDPETLNLKSNGEWITAYIELPESYDVSEIDVGSILLNNAVPVDVKAPITIGDYDLDAIPDLMVKFDRAAIIEWLDTNDYGEDTGKYYEINLTITGTVSGTQFAGTDQVKVLKR